MSKQETQDKIIKLEQRVQNALDFYRQYPETLDILLYEFEQLTGAIRIWMGVGCGGCGGVGRRAYGSTATWRGGAGLKP